MARSSPRYVVLLAGLAVVACAAAAFGANRIVHAQTSRAGARQRAAEAMLTSLLAQSDGADAYSASGRDAMLTRWRVGAAGLNAALADARRLQPGDRRLRDDLTALTAATRRWQVQVLARLTLERATGRRPTRAQTAADQVQLDAVRARYTTYVARLAAVDHAAVRGAGWLAAGLVAAVALALAGLGVALIGRAQRRERIRTRRLGELRELLQVSTSEAESRQLLLRHIQRLLPRAGAAVLSHLESEDRLEPTFGERVSATPLTDLAVGQLPASACLAVRLGRSHARGHGIPDEALVHCEVCGRLAGEVACEPLRVSGRALGAALVASEERIDADDRAQLREAITQSAPLLAIQRNLEAAERRAATDPLTNLPNRRAAEETLRRLSAQAGRSVSPLAAVLVDLDRFKQVNDRHGHAHGDRALSVVADVLVSGVRASDFVARYGGEEFLVLAPDTDRQGAAELAEKLRLAIEQTELPAIGRITASLGVAALPEDAVDTEQMLRKADRALYAAKALGRNRVQEAQPSTTAEG